MSEHQTLFPIWTKACVFKVATLCHNAMRGIPASTLARTDLDLSPLIRINASGNPKVLTEAMNGVRHG